MSIILSLFPFNTWGNPHTTRITVSASSAKRTASRPQFSRSCSAFSSIGITPLPISGKITARYSRNAVTSFSISVVFQHLLRYHMPHVFQNPHRTIAAVASGMPFFRKTSDLLQKSFFPPTNQTTVQGPTSKEARSLSGLQTSRPSLQ